MGNWGDKDGRRIVLVVTARDRPAPGWEPRWRVSDEPVIFVPAPHPAAKCCNGRLPRITQRDAFTRRVLKDSTCTVLTSQLSWWRETRR
jgi:hypothetical protein